MAPRFPLTASVIAVLVSSPLYAQTTDSPQEQTPPPCYAYTPCLNEHGVAYSWVTCRSYGDNCQALEWDYQGVQCTGLDAAQNETNYSLSCE